MTQTKVRAATGTIASQANQATEEPPSNSQLIVPERPRFFSWQLENARSSSLLVDPSGFVRSLKRDFPEILDGRAALDSICVKSWHPIFGDDLGAAEEAFQTIAPFRTRRLSGHAADSSFPLWEIALNGEEHDIPKILNQMDYSPTSGTKVVVFCDLGFLRSPSSDAWMEFGTRLKESGADLYAVVPCIPPDRQLEAVELAKIFSIFALDRNSKFLSPSEDSEALNREDSEALNREDSEALNREDSEALNRCELEQEKLLTGLSFLATVSPRLVRAIHEALELSHPFAQHLVWVSEDLEGDKERGDWQFMAGSAQELLPDFEKWSVEERSAVLKAWMDHRSIQDVGGAAELFAIEASRLSRDTLKLVLSDEQMLELIRYVEKLQQDLSREVEANRETKSDDGPQSGPIERFIRRFHSKI